MNRKQRQELEVKCDDLALEINRAIAMRNLHLPNFALSVSVQVETSTHRINKASTMTWSQLTNG